MTPRPIRRSLRSSLSWPPPGIEPDASARAEDRLAIAPGGEGAGSGAAATVRAWRGGAYVQAEPPCGPTAVHPCCGADGTERPGATQSQNEIAGSGSVRLIAMKLDFGAAVRLTGAGLKGGEFG